MWEIKRNDIVIATTDKLEYHGEWLGESYVTVDVTSPQPISFEIGDFIEYRGERYEINYDPITVKSAPINIKGDAFKYDNIKFNSLADELTRCDFLDIVLNDNNIHYTALPSFRFFATSVRNLADRIQANLNRVYPEKWVVEVASEYEAVETDKDIVVDKIKCWDALALCEKEFKTHFTIRGRHILIGAAGVPTAHLFKYGRGNGLYEIERSAETDQAIVTRLRAYGSTRNMPQRYYNTHFGCIGSFEIASFGTNKIELADPRGIIPNKFFYGKLNGYALGVRLNPETKSLQVEVIDLTQWGDKNAFNQWWDNLNTAMRFTSTEGINFYELPEVNREYTDTAMPNNMAVKHLMLPGFPELTLDPYIDSENISKIGIREGTIFFDGSDEELEEVYPSIEGITAEQLEAAGVNCYSEGELDVLISAEAITDDGVGVVEGNENKPKDNKSTFIVEVKDLGFDINDYLTTSTATISFKSGKLVGREFEIVKCERFGNVEGIVTGYKLTLNRVFDDDVQLWFPYNAYNAESGDKFVLLNIDMPEVYIKAASQRLLEKSNEWLAKNDYARSTYNPKIDEIFMARQHDEAMASGGAIQSLHDTIKEGMQLLFEDDDLGIDAAITIDTLVIKENDKAIPTYEVTLKEEKTVGSLQKVQNKVDSISKGLSQGGGGYNADQIRQMVTAYGKNEFLSKRQKDTASEQINFKKGLTTGEYQQGLIGGKGVGVYTDANGNWVVETDVIKARQDFEVNNLVVNQAEARGGMVIEPAAWLTINNVLEDADAYICYFDTHNGTIANLFKIDDVAYCQRWTPENTDLKFYKRRVIALGTDCIVLSKNTDVNGSGVPAIGDSVIHFGNYTDKNRQYVKVNDVIGGGYERYLGGLDSVNSQGEEYYFAGRENGQNPRWFVGEKNGANIEFKDKELSLNNVKLSVNSTIAGQSIDAYVGSKAEEKVGNLQIGGENIILQSDTQRKEYVVTYNTSETIKAGNTYTLTLWTANVYQTFNIGIGEAVMEQFTTTQSTMEGKCKCTFTVGQDSEGNAISTNAFSVWSSSPIIITINKAKLELGNVSTDWSPNQEEIRKPVAYLERALKESTTIEGGLIATSLIQLGYTIDDNFIVQSGFNGLSSNTGRDIAFWAGGNMIDGEADFVQPVAEDEEIKPASFVVRHNGTGYMAGGTVKIREGEMQIGANLKLADDELRMETEGNGNSFAIVSRETGYANLEALQTPEQTTTTTQSVQAEQLIYTAYGSSSQWVVADFAPITHSIKNAIVGGKVRVGVNMEWLYPLATVDSSYPIASGGVLPTLIRGDEVVHTFEVINWTASRVTINRQPYVRYSCAGVSEEVTLNDTSAYSLRFSSYNPYVSETPSRVDTITLSQKIGVTTIGCEVFQTINGTDGFASHWGDSLIATSEKGTIIRFGDCWLKLSAEGITYNGGQGEKKLV